MSATPREFVLSRLKGVRRGGLGWSALCPAHSDEHQSLSAAEADDGRVLLRCHAGCSVEAIVDALGLKMSALFPPPQGGRTHRRVAATYPYVDETGQLLFEVVRFEPKDFRCRRPNGQGGWIWKIGDVRRVLYRLPDLMQAISENKTIYIVEGEKDADAINRHAAERGLTIFATSNPGGAGKWRREYAEVLRGARVVVVPDKDGIDPKNGRDAGRYHARQVIRSLDRVAASIVVVEAREGKDASDHLAAGLELQDFVPIEIEEPRPDPTTVARKADAGSADEIRSLLTEAGVLDLNANSPMSWIENAMRRLSDLLEGADPLRRALVREDALRHLKAMSIRSRARIVDAALKPPPASAETTMQGRELLLTDPEPWEAPVDGAQLLDDLTAIFRKYVVLPDGAAQAQSLWVLHAHTLDASFASPILGLTSPEKRCGKTTDLEIVGGLVPRPLAAANITPAALFRTVEKYAPTLLIDEADSFLGDNDEMRGILNSGHTRTTARVVRTAGENLEPRIFSTWCPKAIALIGRLPSTLEDRSIHISIRRRRREEKVQRLRRDQLHQELEPLRRRAARWALDNLAALRSAEPQVPDELNDRAQDNWRPLLAIADAAGGGWPDRARNAAKSLSGTATDGDTSTGVALLTDIRALFRSTGAERISSEALVQALGSQEDRPWPEWDKGRPISKTQVAKLLKRYGIAPNTIREGGATPRGYYLSQFDDAFARYLPPEPQQPQQGQNDTQIDPIPNRNSLPAVADREMGKKPHPDCVVADVAARNPLLDGESALRSSPGADGEEDTTEFEV